MACQIFDYSSETLDTGITEIDEIQDQSSLASSDHQVTLEQAAGVTINQGIHIHHLHAHSLRIRGKLNIANKFNITPFI